MKGKGVTLYLNPLSGLGMLALEWRRKAMNFKLRVRNVQRESLFWRSC